MEKRPPSSTATTIITYTVSGAVLAIGIALLAMAHQKDDRFWLDVGRDFGITLCSIGVLSIVYEAFLRKQLISDVERALPPIVNPDASRLGITAIFGTRNDRRTPLVDVLRSAQRDVLLYGLSLYNIAFDNLDVVRELVVARHCRVRVMIFDVESPYGAALENSLGTKGALLVVTNQTTEAFRNLQDQLRAQGIGPERFEARVYRTVPTFGMISLDAGESYGRILVEWNGINVEGQQCPGLELRHSASAPFLFFTKQGESVWDNAITLVPAAQLRS